MPMMASEDPQGAFVASYEAQLDNARTQSDRRKQATDGNWKARAALSLLSEALPAQMFLAVAFEAIEPVARFFPTCLPSRLSITSTRK